MTPLSSIKVASPERASDWSKEHHSDGSGQIGLCRELLQRLTLADLAALARFADYRLTRVGLGALAGEDFVQDALLTVLRGTSCASRGRHPRSADLADAGSFLKYLKGVIGSLVEAQRRQYRHECPHEPIDDEGNADLAALLLTTNADSDATLRDWSDQFFKGLAKRAPGRLHDLIRAWERQWQQTNKIPLNGHHRRHRAELRQLAAHVYKTLRQPIRHQPKRTNP